MNYLNEPPMDYPKCKPVKFPTQKVKNQFVCSCSNLLGTIFKRHCFCMHCVPFIFVWKGPKEILLEFLSCLYSKNDHIKLTYYVIDKSSISFRDSVLYKDANFSTLQVSTYQKPLNKYLYIPFESFHPMSNKRAF